MWRPGSAWEVTVPVTNEELTLAYQLGDTDAGEELLRNVEGLIRHQASKMCWDESLIEDLLQEGRAAALAAAGDYDGERGALFTTYALPRIRAAMVEYLARASLSVSIPAGRYLQLQRVGKLMKSSAEEKDQLSAICQGLGVSMGVAQALRKEWFSFWNGAASLDGLNQMGNDFTSDPAYVYEQGLLLRGIATAVENLPARERNLILRYLGLEGIALNFRELAVLLNYNGIACCGEGLPQGGGEAESCPLGGGVRTYRRARKMVNRAMQDVGRR